MKKFFLLIFYILPFAFLTYCSEEEILPEDELIKIYVDILIAQDTTIDKSITTDSLKTIVLNKYGVPDSLYVKSIEHYKSSPVQWEAFFDNAIKYVEELRINAEE
ncbi:MAG: DUF4296 domain-containing protein [Ignavibacterium sp.]|nr:MAG: DUF4296 domain-containing protein [Ignavibacterium sp.]